MSKTKLSLRDASSCPNGELCPLAHVEVGCAVRIKRLSAPHEVTDRLREMGFCEEQKVKLLIKGNNVICQVCNARLGISTKLAEKILVEDLSKGAAGKSSA